MLARTFSVVNILLVGLTLFILVLPSPLLDPDFGWHLRTGERVVAERGVPRHDWFSYTMPNFPWIAHSWLEDVIVFSAWKTGGFWGVRMWYTFLGVLLIFFVMPLALKHPIERELKNIVGVVLAGTIVDLALFRPQLISAIGFALVVGLVQKMKKTNKAVLAWLLPPLFVLWTNLHGGFPIGFLLLAPIIMVEYFKIDCILRGGKSSFINEHDTLSKESWKALAWASIASLAATLVNPYGWHIYEEVFRTVYVSYPKTIIAEWAPVTIASTAGAILFPLAILVIASFAFLREKPPDITDIVLVVFFFILALTSGRHVFFFVAVATPLLLGTIENFKITIPKNIGPLFTALVATGVLASFALMALSKSENTETQYPKNAVDTVGINGIRSAHIFNSYEWGGYLLFRDPNIKTFIDGRMTFWEKDEKDFLYEFTTAMDVRPGWQEILKKYDVTMVLIQPRESLAQTLTLLPNEWQEIYADNAAVIFRRR